MQPETLLEIASRNGETLPADTVEGLRELYRFRDFDHFIEIWILTTNCLRHEADFRQVVVDYAAEAKRHGAVYLEAIFSPIERTWRGVGWDEIFSGYCDGAQEARELHGVEVRLTPGHHAQRAARGRAHARRGRRAATATAASSPSGSAARRRYYPNASRSSRRSAPPARRASARSRTRARSSARSRCAARSTCSSPTASATASARSRIPALVAELADRGIVLDVTPISNVRTGAVASLEEHPLPRARRAPASAARSRPTTR